MGSRLQEGEGLTLMSSPLKSVLLTILQMGFDNEVGVCVDNAIPYPIEIIVSMPASMVFNIYSKKPGNFSLSNSCKVNSSGCFK